jgi:hypothetical protein
MSERQFDWQNQMMVSKIAVVIARSVSDEAIQCGISAWIASLSLSSGRPLRAGPVGSQ